MNNVVDLKTNKKKVEAKPDNVIAKCWIKVFCDPIDKKYITLPAIYLNEPKTNLGNTSLISFENVFAASRYIKDRLGNNCKPMIFK